MIKKEQEKKVVELTLDDLENIINDRLAAAMKSQKVYVVSSDITDQQTTDTKVIKNIK